MSMAHIICLGFSRGGIVVWNKEVNSFTDTSSCRDLTVSSRPYLCTEMSYASGRMAMRSAMASTMPMPSGLPMLKGRHDFKNRCSTSRRFPRRRAARIWRSTPRFPIGRAACPRSKGCRRTRQSMRCTLLRWSARTEGRSTCGKGLLTLSDAIVITDSPGATCLASA